MVKLLLIAAVLIALTTAGPHQNPLPTSSCDGLLQFTCDNGMCLDNSKMCNGNDDCGDSSDELNCNQPIVDCYARRQFPCDNGVCVDRASLCDGRIDCEDNSDELNCNPFNCFALRQFTCGNGMCVDPARMCDGNDDCGDNSDELNCRPYPDSPSEDEILMRLKGEKGEKGCSGEEGDLGPRGAPGEAGMKGHKGVRGEEGEMGENGANGKAGIQGPPGSPGDPGLPGLCDEKARGSPGAPGPRGPPGPPGPPAILPQGPCIALKAIEGDDGAKKMTCTDGTDEINQYPEKRDARPGDAPLPQRNHRGATFVRWGRTTCPETPETELVYSGRAAGSPHNHRGGTSSFLCLPDEPEYGDVHKEGAQRRSPVVGAEYETFDGEPLEAAADEIVPCAVCHVRRRGAVVTIPASLTCPEKWTMEYSGYLMSSHARFYRRSAVCVDRDPEMVCEEEESGEGALFYHMEAYYSPYNPEIELTCVVCTK